MVDINDLPYVEYGFDDGGTAGRIYADSCDAEELELTAQATRIAVESGSKVSDHIQLDPAAGKITLYFSETPVRGDLDPDARGRPARISITYPEYPDLTPLISPRSATQAVGAAVGAVASLVGLGGGGAADMPSGATVLQFRDGPPNRVKRALEVLTGLFSEKRLITLGLSFARLENMAIEGLRLARTPDSGGGGAIELTLTQIEIVSTETAEALPLPLEPRGQSKKNGGVGGTTGLPEGPQKSAAAAIFDAF